MTKMMTAAEAYEIYDDYINTGIDVDDYLITIGNDVEDAAKKGRLNIEINIKSWATFNKYSINNLELEAVYSELKKLGYKVTPQYNDAREIVRLEISWGK